MHEHPTGPTGPACRAQARPGHAQAGRAPRAQCAPPRACRALPLPAARPRPLVRTPARHASTACAPCACYLRAMRLLPVRPLAPARLRHARSRPPAARAQHAQHARAVPPSARPPSAHLRTPSTPCARLLRPACCASAPTTRPRLPSAQPAQWAVAIQVLYQFFFFFIIYIFFSSLSHWKISKNTFIYFLSFSSTPINLLKFISSIFFFSPTNQINCLNLFYLFSCSSLHIVNSRVCFPTCLCAIYLSTQTFTSHIQHIIQTKHLHTTIHQST